MAKLKNPSDEQGDPRLKRPLDEVRDRISERIESGERLSNSRLPIADMAELESRRQLLYSWDEYNRSLLKLLFAGDIMSEYSTPIGFGGGGSPQVQLREFEQDLSYYLRQLQSIVNRLELWDEAATIEGTSIGSDLTGREAAAIESPQGPIFVVHGHDNGRKAEVARLLERATDREVVILHEQASKGRTIIEKFEDHAATSSFAVVILSADDEGRAKGDSDLRQRGRQNVIFEMGFFFSKLGRSRVVVLCDPDIERPSDVAGIVYITMDPGDGWKYELAKEIGAAKIKIDLNEVR